MVKILLVLKNRIKFAFNQLTNFFNSWFNHTFLKIQAFVTKERLIGCFWFCIYYFDKFIGSSVMLYKYLFNRFIYNPARDCIKRLNIYIYWNNIEAIEKCWARFEKKLEEFSDYFLYLCEKRPFTFNLLTFVFIAAYVDFIASTEDLSVFGELLKDLRWLVTLAGSILSSEMSLLSIIFMLIFVGFYVNPRHFSIPGLTPKVTAFSISTLIFIMVALKVFIYDFSSTFQVASDVFVGPELYKSYPSLFFVFDPISLSFALLVSFIFPIIILTAWEKVQSRENFFYLNVILLEVFSLAAFFTLDLFLFFIFFEIMLVPMSLIILLWGGRQRKIKATSYVFLYTLFGSTFFLIGVIYLYSVFGSTNYFYILSNIHKLNCAELYLLWFAFFVPFAIKIPMFPFHIWLPEAHVEAPTAGSIALAAILLKFGGYGFIRFLIPLFHEPSVYFSPFVIGLALTGLIYASLAATRQTDVKKIIAYSSIAHMNIVVLGIFSFNINAYYGAVTLMLGHGLVSTALFFLSGVLYDRYHTRALFYFGGLSQTMPLFSFFLFFFCAANLGFPCSVSFVGEFFIFLGVFKEFGLLISLLIGASTVFGVYLNMLLFISLCFGPLNNTAGSFYQDLSFRELKVLIALSSVSFLFFMFHAQYFSLLSETASLHFHLFV